MIVGHKGQLCAVCNRILHQTFRRSYVLMSFNVINIKIFYAMWAFLSQLPTDLSPSRIKPGFWCLLYKPLHYGNTHFLKCLHIWEQMSDLFFICSSIQFSLFEALCVFASVPERLYPSQALTNKLNAEWNSDQMCNSIKHIMCCFDPHDRALSLSLLAFSVQELNRIVQK